MTDSPTIREVTLRTGIRRTKPFWALGRKGMDQGVSGGPQEKP
ncbi:hypothetical protein AB0I28_05250 [Phytomonospora sp. NPDC050363]